MNLEIEKIVRSAQTGDHQAYEKIVEKFQKMALSYAYSILGNYELAEDARQEAFIAAYLDLASLQSPAAFPAWFKRIVHRRSIRIKRSIGVLEIPLESAPEQRSKEPGPRRSLEFAEERTKAEEAIKRLPKHERLVTKLYYLDMMSMREIENSTGISISTTKSRLHRARAKMRRNLLGLVNDEAKLSYKKEMKTLVTTEAIKLLKIKLESLLNAAGSKQFDEIGHIICGMAKLYLNMGKVEQAQECLDGGMQIPRLLCSTNYRVRYYVDTSMALIRQSNHKDAKVALTKARDIVRKQQGSRKLSSTIWIGFGICAWQSGNLKYARKCYTRALEDIILPDQLVWKGEIHQNIALLDWKAGKLLDAKTGFEISLRIWRRLKIKFTEMTTLMNLAIIEENLGMFTLADRHYHKVLLHVKKEGYIQVEAIVLTNLSNLFNTQEKWSKSVALCSEAIELSRKLKDKRNESIALENMALAYIGLAQPINAQRAINESRRIIKKTGDSERLFSLELTEIHLFSEQKKLEELPNRLKQISKKIKRLGYISEVPRLLRLQGHVEFELGKLNLSLRTLSRAEKECTKQGNAPEKKNVKRILKKVKKKIAITKRGENV